jgi:hypothetical protein
LKIALDYDKTFNLDPDFWSEFEILAHKYKHEVRIVTARSPKLDRLSKDRVRDIPVIYCDGVAKRFVCTHFADDYKGWIPDVWIDDKPESVDKNSTATREILEEWRKSEEYTA